MPQPAALFLAHFDAPPAKAAGVDLAPAAEMAPIWEPEPIEDHDALIASAHEAGRAEGLEAARAEAETEAEAMRQGFGEQLAAERAKWLAEESEPLKEKLAVALADIKESLADSVGQILRPFVVDVLRREMLDELVAHVATIAASHDAIELRISAPADLVEILRDKLMNLPLAIHYEPSDGVDILVVAGQTTIETRLKAWIDLFRAKME
jgi:flagellar biosynthesis/type III secretory pathway protein FliH